MYTVCILECQMYRKRGGGLKHVLTELRINIFFFLKGSQPSPTRWIKMTPVKPSVLPSPSGATSHLWPLQKSPTLTRVLISLLVSLGGETIMQILLHYFCINSWYRPWLVSTWFRKRLNLEHYSSHTVSPPKDFKQCISMLGDFTMMFHVMDQVFWSSIISSESCELRRLSSISLVRAGPKTWS